MTSTSTTRRTPRHLIILIATAILTTLTAGITAAATTSAHAATVSLTSDAQAGPSAVNPAYGQIPTSLNFDRKCYTFAGDMDQSCGIRLARKTSEALFAGVKTIATTAFNFACIPLLTPFVGPQVAIATCNGIANTATSQVSLPAGQTFWIGISGPKEGYVILVDVDDPATASAPSATTPAA